MRIMNTGYQIMDHGDERDVIGWMLRIIGGRSVCGVSDQLNLQSIDASSTLISLRKSR